MSGVDLSAFPDGTPVTEIAATLGVTVREVRWSLGAPLPRALSRRARGGDTPKAVADAIVAAYLAGDRIADIAAATGRSPSTVVRCVQAAGVPKRRRRRRWVDGRLVDR
ncbi:MAG TPA: hypothetical protein VFA84_11280 [Acidimicrobiales bacterium]|nr:hypothetical protein [Acidimicrobiales bacterium]